MRSDDIVSRQWFDSIVSNSWFDINFYDFYQFFVFMRFDMHDARVFLPTGPTIPASSAHSKRRRRIKNPKTWIRFGPIIYIWDYKYIRWTLNTQTHPWNHSFLLIRNNHTRKWSGRVDGNFEIHRCQNASTIFILFVHLSIDSIHFRAKRYLSNHFAALIILGPELWHIATTSINLFITQWVVHVADNIVLCLWFSMSLVCGIYIYRFQIRYIPCCQHHLLVCLFIYAIHNRLMVLAFVTCTFRVEMNEIVTVDRL